MENKIGEYQALFNQPSNRFDQSLYFIPRRTLVQFGCATATLLIITLSAHTGVAKTVWSPYYKIQYEKDLRRISTNNIGRTLPTSDSCNGSSSIDQSDPAG